MTQEYKVYGYRWIVLAAFMAITVIIEVQWLAHAAIARAAEVFYTGQFSPDSLFNIDFLAMSYMLVFLVACVPASYVIDTFGIKVGLGVGAVMTAVFSLVKGIWGSDFQIVMAAQIGLAAAQPFILNAVTAVSVRWFPINERGTAAGLSALAQYLGIIIAMGVTPLLVVTSPAADNYGSGIKEMLLVYGIISAVVSVAAFFLIKERPPTPPARDKYVHTRFFEGFRHIFGRRDMIITLVLFFIGLGIFNAVSSMVDSITGSLGVSDSTGLIGVLMIVGGIIGALILPTLSDKYRRRKTFLVICMGGMVPAMAGLAFADLLFSDPATVYHIALISSFILGFFVMSAGPIGFQYAAEVSYPAPESSSQGLLLLSGQISGIVLVALMSVRDNRFLDPILAIFVLLSVAAFMLVLMLKESPMIITEDDRLGKADKDA